MIQVFCATKGRPSLDLLVRSFISQQLMPTDHLTIIGDDWSPTDRGDTVPAWLGHPQVTFFRASKSKYFGHKHLVDSFKSVPDDQWFTAMGDDDVYCPDAFVKVRRHLSPFAILITGYWGWQGSKIDYITVGKKSRQELTCIQQTFTPGYMKWPDFSEYSDAEAFRRLKKDYGYPLKYMLGMQTFVFRAPLMARNKQLWNKLLPDIEWTPEIQKMRT